MYSIRNQETDGGVFTLAGDMCYDNKLMTGGTTIPNAQHSAETVYLNVRDGEGACTKAHRRWYRKYATWGRFLDLVLILLIAAFICVIEYGIVPHVTLGFYCADPALSHQFTGDTITAKILLTVSFFGPMVFIYGVESSRRDGGATFKKMWYWYRGYLITQLCFLIFSQVVKTVAGEHRPHFFHTCAPDAAETCTPGEYVTDYRCMNTGGFGGYIVPDTSLSFPSAHAGLGFIWSIFCAVLVHVRFNNRHIGIMARPTLVASTLTWGFAIGISRVFDHRHHWWDVLAGAILGSICAVYGIYYYCDMFKVTPKETGSSSCRTVCRTGSMTSRDGSNRAHVSTTALVDAKNRDATSVII